MVPRHLKLALAGIFAAAGAHASGRSGAPSPSPSPAVSPAVVRLVLRDFCAREERESREVAWPSLLKCRRGVAKLRKSYLVVRFFVHWYQNRQIRVALLFEYYLLYTESSRALYCCCANKRDAGVTDGGCACSGSNWARVWCRSGPLYHARVTLCLSLFLTTKIMKYYHDVVLSSIGVL